MITSVIDLFRWYMNKYFPQISNEDWLVDVVVAEREAINNKEIKELISKQEKIIKCFIFFEQRQESKICMIIQNKTGNKNILIGFIHNNRLLHYTAF